jgi:hypothetical protein
VRDILAELGLSVPGGADGRAGMCCGLSASDAASFWTIISPSPFHLANGMSSRQ